MAALDYSLYPHLVDAILACTATSDLKWRQTSCKLRARATRLLCNHLLLTPHTALAQTSPAWADYPPSMRIPGLPLGLWRALYMRDPALDLHAATTIHNIDGRIPPYFPFTLFTPAFPALEVLRLRTSTLPRLAPVLSMAVHTLFLSVCSQDDPAPSPTDDPCSTTRPPAAPGP